MTRIVVAGAAGRMGRQIVQAVSGQSDLRLVGAFERPGHPALGQDAGLLAGAGEVRVAVVGSLEDAAAGAEVLIDFTAPQATLANLEKAVALGLTAVVGTTGFSTQEKEKIAGLAQVRPVVLAPNMSVGVNLLFKLCELAAKALGPDWDLEVVEAHHHFKEDAPSGTALKLAEILAQARGVTLSQAAVYARQGRVGPRNKGEIGLQTVRAGDIVGEHTVYLAGTGERLELIHRAGSRANFAQGAVRAARWVVGQKPGLYDMQDVLGLK